MARLQIFGKGKVALILRRRPDTDIYCKRDPCTNLHISFQSDSASDPSSNHLSASLLGSYQVFFSKRRMPASKTRSAVSSLLQDSYIRDVREAYHVQHVPS